MENLDEERKDFIKEKIPGPYSFIVKIKKEYIKDLVPVLDNKKLGIRIPKNEFCQNLAQKLGFTFTSTSADITNLPPAHSLFDFKKQLNKVDEKFWPDLFIDAGVLPKNNPSKIIDLTV